MRASNERTGEVLRVVDDGGEDQPRVSVRFGGAAEVLGQYGVRAVRHAVFLQIAGPHVRRDHLQIARVLLRRFGSGRLAGWAHAGPHHPHSSFGDTRLDQLAHERRG